jgi:RNA polymerase sigma factor (sigma-70 family)
VEQSDSVLLENWVTRRDAEAITAIVARHSRMVFATCRRILGNPSDAEDVAQECFIKLAGISHVGPSVGGLLHTIATRESLNRRRSESRRRTREKAYSEAIGAEAAATWDDVQYYVDEAITALPEDLRGVVVRHFLEGETHESIAQDLGITRAGVTHRAERAIDRIRDHLRKQGLQVTGLALSAALAAQTAEAIPPTLQASLGRLALSGDAQSASLPARNPTVWGGMSLMKTGILLLVAAIMGVGTVMWTRPSEVGSKTEPQATTAAVVPSTETVAQAEEPSAPAKADSASLPVVEPSETRTIRGHVKSATGFARPTVYFTQDWPYGIWDGPQSDADGNFTLENVPNGATHWMAWSQNTQKAALFTIPEGPVPEVVEVTLDCNVLDLLGRVVDESGKGVPKARVELRFDASEDQFFTSGKLITDVQGYYTSEDIPTRDGLQVRARVVPPGGEAPTPWTTPQPFAARLHYIEISEITVSEATAKNIIVNESFSAPGLGSCSLDSLLNAPPMERYGGLVQDPEGRPIPNVRVELEWERTVSIMSHTAGTDEQGRWSRLMPTGLREIQVRLSHPKYVTVGSGGVLRTTAERLRDMSSVLVMKPGLRIAGRVCTPQGQPAPDALVAHDACLLTPGGPEVTANAPIEDSSCTRTGVDGTFALACLLEGKTELQVRKRGYAPMTVPVEVAPGNQPLTIVLDQGGTVRGRIVDPDGNPIARGYVNAMGPSFSLNTNTIADEDGQFILRNVPSNVPLQVSFGLAREQRGTQGEFLSLSMDTLVPREEPYEIVLHHPIVFEGTVVDAETGAPVTKFDICTGWCDSGGEYPRWIDTSSVSHILSPDGKFKKKLEGVSVSLDPKPFVVGVSAEGYVPAISLPVKLGEPADPMVIRLKKGEPMTGLVLDPLGSPAGDATVCWIAEGGRALVRKTGLWKHAANARVIDVKADTDGRFTLPPSDEPGTLLFLHEKGYAVFDSRDTIPGAEFRLTAWARVEAVARRAGAAKSDDRISLVIPRSTQRTDPVEWSLSETTEADGRFLFEYVPAEPMVAGRFGWYRDETLLSHAVSFTPKPGETAHIEIGAAGRTVTGELRVPPEVAADFEPKQSCVFATAVGPAENDGEGEGKWPRQGFVAELQDDATFQFDDMPPGEYELTAGVAGPRPPSGSEPPPELAHATLRFSVPDDGGSAPISLPVVELQPAM